MSRLPESVVRALPSVAVALLLGCSAVGPDFTPPERPLPGGWRQTLEAGLVAADTASDAEAELASWWRRYEDPLLDDLVARALGGGLDVREALARVAEARALRGVAAADRVPGVDARAAYERRSDSDNTPGGSFIPDSDDWSLGFDATWELDVWGRVRRSVEAADADLGASVEHARDVAVSVAAEVARTYVKRRAFQRRLDIARQNVDLQQQTLDLARTRLDAGLVGERDEAQALTNVESTRARVPALEIGLRAAENRLAVLLGLPPGALADELAVASGAGVIPVPPTTVVVGAPADLLRRRPDVRRAEQELAAETARIGVARAELYPRLALNGRLGLASDSTGDLFERESGVFGLGPSLRWNVFDGGRLRHRMHAQDARAEQALVAWERVVLSALEEAENAMTAFVREQSRRAALDRAATEAARAVQLAQTQYREGLTDFQAVVDTERTVAELQDELALSEAAIATSGVALFKALGGGWQAYDPVVARASRVDDVLERALAEPVWSEPLAAARASAAPLD